MTKLGIFITQYSLLVYILIDKDWKETKYLWLNTRIDSSIKNNMKKCGVNHMWGDFADGIKIKSSRWIFHRAFVKLAKYILLFRVKFNRICFYKKNSTHVYGQDHASLSKIFYGYKFITIEDGTANYLKKEYNISLLKKNAKHLLKDGVPFGYSSRVDEVFLTGRKKIEDDTIRAKATIFDIKTCWDNKTTIEKNEILFVFGYNVDRMKQFTNEGRDIFLITQNYAPLYCSYNKLLNIYKSFLSNIDHKRVIIKPHPGDNAPYEKFFPKCKVLRENFPFELVYLTGFPVNKIISINSTSIYGLWDDDIIESHEEIVHKILESEEDKS